MLTEWAAFCTLIEGSRELVRVNYLRVCNGDERAARAMFYKQILSDPTIVNDYPACISAVYISEVVPSNSTVCEQGFSVTTLLKSNLQAKLSTEKLDDKLRIYFAFRKYGHDDALFKSLDIPNLDALVQEWYETTPESTLSVVDRKNHFKRKFVASKTQPHMKKSRAVESGEVDGSGVPMELAQALVTRGASVRAFSENQGWQVKVETSWPLSNPLGLPTEALGGGLLALANVARRGSVVGVAAPRNGT